MPYTLTALLSDSDGPEFAFDGGEARLGRTSDNDIVVKDPNASRAHCRVFAKGGQHWLEDKSANGTVLNGKAVHGAVVELKHGDKFSIGEVTFSFTVQTTPSTEIPKHYEFDESSTVVRGSDARLHDRRAAVVQTHMAPAYDPTAKERERSTRRAPAAPKRAPEPPPPPQTKTEEVESPPVAPSSAPAPAGPPTTLIPKADTSAPTSTLEDPPPAAAIEKASSPPPVAKASSPLPVAQPAEADRVRVRRGKDKAPEDDSELFEPTAAQKARVRRAANKTTLGRISYQWQQLALPWRAVTVLVGLAFVGGIAAVVWTMLAPPPKRVLPSEPTELTSLGPVVDFTFGAGLGVDYERPDLKAFDFKAVSPTRLVGLLHYQAKNVGKDEVAILLNGQDLGFVPADVANTAERELEVVLPADQIKRNEANQLVFDNVRNPPGSETWAVWNLWLQLLPLPDLSVAETPAAVQEDLKRAQKFYDLREIGPDALFNAWRAYRDAWLKLESMPGRPSDLYAIARGQQAETWRLLDRRCRLMQVDVQRALTKTKPDYDTARVVLKDMLRYFPTREHPCHNLVNNMLEQLDR